jgi:hypothetical protein
MPAYDATLFRGTHNSYSGGARGSLVDQLGAGVRWLEIDVHARGFAALGDFRVGHLKPGSEVAFGDGNPDSALLGDWLAVVARWSSQHAHAPITLVLDAKDDLVSPDCGSPEDLNRRLEAAFGARLFTRDEHDRAGSWPDVAALGNRIVAVLSGNGNTRASYRWAFGTEPAMSVNSRGDVVVVYRSTAGDLNCFVGAIGDAGSIEWQHKSTYCFSRMPLSRPAVGVNDEGWIVAAHQFEPPEGFVGARLESMVGRIGEDRRVTWYRSDVFAQGGAPSLELQGNEVRALHATGGGRRQITGSLNTRRRTIDWGRARKTQSTPPPSDRALWRGRTLRCGTDPGGAVVCGSAAGALPPVRFRQVVFVEEQKGDARESMRDALFFAADAKDRPALDAARRRGQVVRAWGFEQADVPGQAQVPATDEPRAAWYERYTDGVPV